MYAGRLGEKAAANRLTTRIDFLAVAAIRRLLTQDVALRTLLLRLSDLQNPINFPVKRHIGRFYCGL
jgi:hypothetical protein